MAVAVSSRLEFERLCQRRAFIDEASLRRHCVEFVQATTSLISTPEYNHVDLPSSNMRLDVVARAKESAPLAMALEAKWLDPEKGVRQWSFEIGKDILRLERISTETNQQTERALVVAGISRTVNSKLIDGEINVPGSREAILPHILQPKAKGFDFPYKQKKIFIRECEAKLRKFFYDRAKAVSNQLPVSYQVSLAGHHLAGPTRDSIEMYIWIIRRSRNRSLFNPSTTWQSDGV